MEPGSIFYFPPATASVVNRDGMVSVRIIIIKGKTCGDSEGVIKLLTEFPEET